jgi:hypothetical protein
VVGVEMQGSGDDSDYVLVQIPLWGMGVGPFKLKSSVAVKMWHVKEPSLLKVMGAKHRSKFAGLLPVVVTAIG